MNYQMTKAIINRAEGKAALKASVVFQGQELTKGTEIRRHTPGSFSVRTWIVQGFASARTWVLRQDGSLSGFGDYSESRQEMPAVVVKDSAWDKYEIWTAQDIAEMIEANRLYGDNPPTPLG